MWGRCGVRGDAVRDTEVAQHLQQGGRGERCGGGVGCGETPSGTRKSRSTYIREVWGRGVKAGLRKRAREPRYETLNPESQSVTRVCVE